MIITFKKAPLTAGLFVLGKLCSPITLFGLLVCNFVPKQEVEMEELIVNKVAESGLLTIDLEDYYPKGDIKIFDLKDYLFMGLILKEKDFRLALQNKNWEDYAGANVGITCSTDAIIPAWAYMLVASYLQPFAREVAFGDEKALISSLMLKGIAEVKGEEFIDKRVIVKGCGDVKVPEAAYLEITNTLRPYVKSIMYGEACSNVPVYKRK